MNDLFPNVLRVWDVWRVFPKYHAWEKCAVVIGALLFFGWILTTNLHLVPGFWGSLRGFRKYGWRGRMFITVVPLIIGLWFYLITIGRPTPFGLVIDISHEESVARTPPGNFDVMFGIANDSVEGLVGSEGELHNIYVEFHTEGTYLTGQSAAPTRRERFTDFEVLFFQFEVPLLHQSEFHSVLTLRFRIPSAGKNITIRCNAVASETKWTGAAWTLVSDGNTLRIEAIP